MIIEKKCIFLVFQGVLPPPPHFFVVRPLKYVYVRLLVILSAFDELLGVVREEGLVAEGPVHHRLGQKLVPKEGRQKLNFLGDMSLMRGGGRPPSR